MDIAAVDQTLRQLAVGDEKYAAFQRRIVNTNKRVYGVRTPALRHLSKQLARYGIGAAGGDGNNETPPLNAADIRIFLRELDETVYEQVLLGGLLINYTKMNDETMIDLIRCYLPLVDSWAGIDTFVERRARFRADAWWNFACENLHQDGEFFVRYGVIMLMSNFLTPDSMSRVFTELRTITHDGYYIKMAMAWLYAEAALVSFDQTMNELSIAPIDVWIKKKAMQKMKESRRFTSEQQAIIAKERGAL